MEDSEIVDLYWDRDEAAISHTQEKYDRYLTKIAWNILALEYPGRRRGQPGERQRHLPRRLELHATPPAGGAVHLPGEDHPADFH